MTQKSIQVHSAWKAYKSVITTKKTSLDGINVDNIISSFFCPGPFYCFIFDFPTLSYSYIDPNLKALFGADPEGFVIDDLIALVHPDDIPHMANGEKMAFEFIIKHMPVEKRKKYKLTYSMRMKTANGNYKLFQQQALALTLDEDGNLGKVIGVHTDISHITTTNNYKVSFLGIDGEPSYYNLDPLKVIDGLAPSRPPFTRRELEIIKLSAEGYMIKEIADKLFISHATVRTHQKKCLSKSGCNTIVELVSHCIREGLI